MTLAPSAWFEVLEVNADDVARVGYSLADYADEQEAPRVPPTESNVEHLLMLATTITEAATLLVLIDPAFATELLVRAATLFEAAEAPEARVLGMASGGAWRPSHGSRDPGTSDRPSDAMSSLAALNAFLEQTGEGHSTAWEVAHAFGDNPALGWNATGVPAKLFEEFASSAMQRDIKRAVRALDLIIARSDEVLRIAQEQDRWRWRRFLADVSLIDPELLALGSVVSKVDPKLISQVQAHELSPARVALLAGIRLSDARAGSG